MRYIPALLILILFAQLYPKEARDLAGQAALAAVTFGVLAAIGCAVVALVRHVPADDLVGYAVATGFFALMLFSGRANKRRRQGPATRPAGGPWRVTR
jgi:peptidoglycan/LPS O-acetylase OafA/YrhL